MSSHAQRKEAADATPVQTPAGEQRRGRRVEAVVRARPRWPGRESANPSAYVANGSSIVPNPAARRQMIGARATSVGTCIKNSLPMFSDPLSGDKLHPCSQ